MVKQYTSSEFSNYKVRSFNLKFSNPGMIISASPRISGAPTPTHFIPALCAASTPATASSKTMHCAGGILSILAPVRNTSGSGFAWVMMFPSTIASKKSVMAVLESMLRAFLLTDPSPISMPDFFNFSEEFPYPRKDVFRCHFFNVLKVQRIFLSRIFQLFYIRVGSFFQFRAGFQGMPSG